ncbi:MAG: TolC family protein [Pseudomonadota bacterium]
MNKLAATVLLILLVFISNVWGNELDDPHKLAKMAIKLNPGIESISNKIDSLEYAKEASSIWSDPVLSVNYLNTPYNSLAMGETAMSALQIMLKQTFPLPGKNPKRVSILSSELKASKHYLEEEKQKLAYEIISNYWKLMLIRELEIIYQKHLKLLDGLILSVRSKYQTGKSLQQDLLSLEVLKEKLTDDLGDFKKDKIKQLSKINFLMDWKLNTEIKTPTFFMADKINYTNEKLYELAEKGNYLLKYLKEIIQKEKIKAEQIDFERWPDLSVFGGYSIRQEAGLDNGRDFLSFGISMPIPVNYTGSFKNKKNELLKNALSFENRYNDTLNEIKSKIDHSMANWMRAYKKANNYETKLIVLSETSYQTTLSAYKSDITDFSSLYEAQLQLLEFEKTLIVSKIGTKIEKIKVETIIGKSL